MVQAQRGVVGRHGLWRRVVGLVVAVRVVLLHLAIVGEDVGGQLDWGDSAAVSHILCVAKAKEGRAKAARQSDGHAIAERHNTDGGPPTTTTATRSGRGSLPPLLGLVRQEKDGQQKERGYHGYQR